MIIPGSKEEICILLLGMKHICRKMNTKPFLGLIFNKTATYSRHFCIIRHDLHHLFQYIVLLVRSILSHLPCGPLAYTRQQEVFT